MNNYSTSRIATFVLLSILLLSCKKEPLAGDDYRLQFIGNYTCIGMTHDWDDASGLNEYSVDTITLTVKNDATSNNMICVNNDTIPIDTSGYFADPHLPGYSDYVIHFFSKDSVKYYIATGALGWGHWGNYLGSK